MASGSASSNDSLQLAVYGGALSDIPTKSFDLPGLDSAIKGLWSDGESMWVLDIINSEAVAYDFSGSSLVRDSSKDFTTETSPEGSGVDAANEIVYIMEVDSNPPTAYAYSLSGTRQANKDISGFNHSESSTSTGLWFNGNTFLVSGTGRYGIMATYHSDSGLNISNLASDLSDEGINTTCSNWGVWSDGTTMWTSCDSYGIRAFKLSDGSRDSDRDIPYAPEHSAPRGLWSDGETMWVLQDESEGTTDKVFSYKYRNNAEGLRIHGSPVTGHTLSADTSSITDPNGLPDSPDFSYQWQYADGTDIAGATDKTYHLTTADVGKKLRVRVSFTDNARYKDEIFSEPVKITKSKFSSNSFDLSGLDSATRGLWSDGESMWVLDIINSEAVAYDFSGSSLVRDSSKDFNTETSPEGSGVNAANEIVYIMEVDSNPPTAYAYSLSGTRQANKDISGFNHSESSTSTGLWFNGNTFLVSGTGRYGIMATYHSDSGLNISNLASDLSDEGINTSCANWGVWSDGTTMWTSCDSYGIRAFKLSDGSRDSDRDIPYAPEHSAPRGLWSDGKTMWVLQDESGGTTDKVFSYKYRNNAKGLRIHGSHVTGHTLSADTSSITDPNGLPDSPDFSYQWQYGNGEDIAGATDRTYYLKAADAGRKIQVRVRFTDNARYEEEIFSEPTGAIQTNIAPVFSQSEYVFYLNEDDIGNESAIDLGTISATDNDATSITLTFKETTAFVSINRKFRISQASLDFSGIFRYVGDGEEYNKTDETQNKYVYTIRANDRRGNISYVNVTIYINDPNEPPVFSQSEYVFYLDENINASGGRENHITLGTISATDNDAASVGIRFNDTDAFVSPDSKFRISQTNLEFSGIFRYQGEGEDYENKSKYVYTIKARDNKDNTAYVNVTVYIRNINEGGNETSVFNQSEYVYYLDENRDGSGSGNHIPLGRINVDFNGDAGIFFSENPMMGDSSDNKFRLEHISGTLHEFRYVGSGEDYENKSKYVYTIYAHYNRSREDVNVTIYINDVDEDSTLSFGSDTYTGSLHENRSGSEMSINLLPIDYTTSGEPDNVMFFFVDSNTTNSSNGKFSLQGGGVDVFSSVVEFHYIGTGEEHDENPQYVYAIGARDDNGNTAYANVTVNILNYSNSPPVFNQSEYIFHLNEYEDGSGDNNHITLGTITVTDDESVAVGFIGSIKSSYSKDGKFRVKKVTNSNSYEIRYIGTGEDHGITNIYKHGLFAVDTADSYGFANITVHIVFVNNPPVFSSGSTFSVNENLRNVGTVTASDSDTRDTITSYTISGGEDSAKFTINSNTGALRFKTGFTPDFESPSDVGGNNEYKVSVQVTSGTGTRELISTQDITVNITDVNEPPSRPAKPALNSLTPTSIYVIWVAPNNKGPAITDYDVQYRQGSTGPFSNWDHVGTATTATIANLSTSTSYQVRVRAKNPEGTSFWSYTSSITTGTQLTPDIYRVEASDITENGAKITVTVRNPDGTSRNIYYKVERGFRGSLVDSGSVNTSTSSVDFTLSGLREGEEHTVYASFNSNISEGPKRSVTFTPEEPNDPPVLSRSYIYFNLSSNIDGSGSPFFLGRVKATDNEDDTLNFTLIRTDNNHSDKFSINSRTGDFYYTGTGEEYVGLDRQYFVVFELSDGVNSPVTSSITIIIINNTDQSVNTRPSFTTGSTFQVNENTRNVGTVAASDSDNEDSVTGYSISGGDDISLFSITNGGVLTFNSAPDFEKPSDANGDNTYILILRVTSGTGNRARTQTQDITVTVTDADEPPSTPAAPILSSPTPNSLSVMWSAPENKGPDIDEYDVQYRKDSSSSFSNWTHADNSTSTTITGLDANTQYYVRVLARNDEGESAWSPTSGATTGSEPNTAPSFTSSSTTIPVEENTINVGTVTATDSDSQDTVTKYNISGGADNQRFSITSGGVLTFVSAPDFENPDDNDNNNEYEIQVTATSGAGSRVLYSEVQTITITVTDVNESPSTPEPPILSSPAPDSLFVSWTSPENTGPAINDYDVQYRKGSSGSFDNWPHTDDSTNTTITGLDADTEYEVRVLARNDEGESIWSQPSGFITGTVNHPPSFTSGSTFTVEENTRSVGTVMVSDNNTEDGISNYEISAGPDKSLFSIADDGVLTFDSAPDYERPSDDDSNNVYNLVVKVTSGTRSREMSSTQDITINVSDVNEPPSTPLAPTLSSPAPNSLFVSWSVPENKGPDIIEYDVQYRKGSTGEFRNWSHTDDSISTNIMELEADTLYQVRVRARNDEGESAWSQPSGYTTRSVNHPPSFRGSSTFSVKENTRRVGAVAASDPDYRDIVTGYRISAGADSSLFSITNSDVLTFDSAPDFDNPSDSNKDNDYIIIVSATSGTGNRVMSATREITITVTNVNDEPPVFELDSYLSGLDENKDGSSNPIFLRTVNANDEDSQDNVRYSITEGDTDKFNIDPESGNLTYVGEGEDYESTTTQYNLTVKASDGTNEGTVDVTINIEDINDGEEFGFYEGEYKFNLTENINASSDHVEVGTVKAVNNASDIIYDISEGDTNKFNIDSSTGKITYIGEGEDYETTKQYNLTIQADDTTENVTAKVIINIEDILEITNEPPRAEHDEIGIISGDTTSVLSNGDTSVRDNDEDEESPLSQLRVTLVSGPRYGDLNLNIDGTFTYRHYGNSTTDDNFEYSVSDGINSSSATVTISVQEDTSSPTISVTSPPNGTSTTDNTPEISFAGMDETSQGAVKPLTFKIFVDNAFSGERTGNSDTSISYNLSALSIGRHTFWVEATDPAGNSKNSSKVTININREPTTTSSGGGRSSSSSSGTRLDEGDPEEFKIRSGGSSVVLITVEANERVNNVKIKAKKIRNLPSSADDITDGEIYEYVDITAARLDDDEIEEAEIEFVISRDWLSDNGFDKDEMIMIRYTEDDDWEELDTDIIGENSRNVRYSADTDGFLELFAIVARDKPETETQTPIAETTPETQPVINETGADITPTETQNDDKENDKVTQSKQTPVKTKPQNNLLITISLIALTLIVLVAAVYLISKKSKRRPPKIKNERKPAVQTPAVSLETPKSVATSPPQYQRKPSAKYTEKDMQKQTRTPSSLTITAIILGIIILVLGIVYMIPSSESADVSHLENAGAGVNLFIFISLIVTVATISLLISKISGGDSNKVSVRKTKQYNETEPSPPSLSTPEKKKNRMCYSTKTVPVLSSILAVVILIIIAVVIYMNSAVISNVFSAENLNIIMFICLIIVVMIIIGIEYKYKVLSKLRLGKSRTQKSKLL